jgi:hypothetical protein
MMSLQDFELFYINWLLHFHKQFMQEGATVAYFFFVEAENALVFS